MKMSNKKNFCHKKKFAIPTFFAFLLFFQGCTPEEPAKEPVQNVYPKKTQLNIPAPKPINEPISPLTTMTYPHLTPFTGHLVAGSPQLQVVIAGIPPSGRNPKQDSILAVFRYEHGYWTRVDTLDTSQVSIPSGSRGYYYPIGLENETNPSASIIRVILQSSRNRSRKAILEYKVLLKKPVLEMTLSGLPRNRSHQWQLHIFTSIKTSNKTFFETGEEKGVLLFHRESPIHLKSHGGTATISPYKTSLNLPANEKIGWHFSQSKGTVAQEGYYNLTIKSSDSEGGDAFFNPVLIRSFQQQKLIDYLQIPPNTKQKITLKSGHSYQIINAISGQDSLGISKSINQQDHKITLPSIMVGELNLKPPTNYTQTQKIRLIIERDSSPFDLSLLDLNQPIIEALARNEVIIEKWPSTLTLPTGNYLIGLINELDNLLCVGNIKIEDDESTFNCPKMEMNTTSNTGEWVDFSNPHGNIDGLYFSHRTLHVIEKPDGPRDNLQYFAARTMVKNDFLQFRTFPTTEEFANKWLSFRKEQNGYEIKKFINFTQANSPNSLLELPCTPLGEGLEHLRMNILAHKPTAIQAFGCGSKVREDTIFDILDNLNRKLHPIVVTPYHSEGNANNHLPLYRPRLVRFGQGEFEKDLKKGNYSLFRGVLISVQPTPSKKRSQQITILTAPGVFPERLEVIPIDKSITSKPLDKSLGPKWSTTVSLPYGTKIVRFAVYGSDLLDKNILLGTTGYIPL